MRLSNKVSFGCLFLQEHTMKARQRPNFSLDLHSRSIERQPEQTKEDEEEAYMQKGRGTQVRPIRGGADNESQVKIADEREVRGRKYKIKQEVKRR